MKNEVNKASTIHLGMQIEILQPVLYQVFLHNDDFTPMEFVVGALERFFYMDRLKATDTSLEAHIKGKAGCGVFTKDFAETVISQIVDYARIHEFPLVCSMEAAS